MKQRQYKRKIGTKTVMGTDFPIHLIVFKNGNRWTLAERCNGTCRSPRDYRTKAEAVAEAESYSAH